MSATRTKLYASFVSGIYMYLSECVFVFVIFAAVRWGNICLTNIVRSNIKYHMCVCVCNAHILINYSNSTIWNLIFMHWILVQPTMQHTHTQNKKNVAFELCERVAIISWPSILFESNNFLWDVIIFRMNESVLHSRTVINPARMHSTVYSIIVVIIEDINCQRTTSKWMSSK